jgi:DNA polymerase III subunit epsilon
MYLFFDVETNGLPKERDQPVSNVDNWPRIVQIAWKRCDKNGDILASHCYIIKPNGFTIPQEAVDKHCITTDKALKEGVSLLPVLKHFSEDLQKSKVLVAHNIAFDRPVIASEFIRANISHSLFNRNTICTMKETTDVCQIEKDWGYKWKWPKLEELYMHLFGKEMENAHHAMFDVNATIKCFWELQRRNVIRKHKEPIDLAFEKVFKEIERMNNAGHKPETFYVEIDFNNMNGPFYISTRLANEDEEEEDKEDETFRLSFQ